MRNDKMVSRLKYCAIWIFIIGFFGGFIFIGFFPLAVLVWGTTFVFGYLFRAAAVIIARLDDIWMAMNPTNETQVETIKTE